MTNVSEQQYVQNTQWAPQGDPKATAKAAKAYAKAMRPWYKKKRFIVPIGLVAVVGISTAANGGGTDSGPTVPAAHADTKAGHKPAEKAGNVEPSAAPAELGTQASPVKIGQPVDLEGTRYTVDNVRTASKVGPGFMAEKADGVFVVVDLTIENLKNESKVFMDSAAQFAAADGTSYSTDTDASIVIADDSLFMTEMQPDLPTHGKLVFDVPQAKLKGGLLEVSDLFGGGEAYINLGL